MYALFLNGKRKPTIFFSIHAFFVSYGCDAFGVWGWIEKMEENLCVSQGRMFLRFLLFFAGFVEISAGLAKISERLVDF